MSTNWRVLLALLLVVALFPAGVAPVHAAEECPSPVTSTDATGTSVTVTERPGRVVTLGPSAAQTLYEIDAWDRVVGVTANADYLPGAGEKTQLGNPFFEASAVTERTIAADPDLVLVPNAYRYSVQVDTLREAGLTVYVFEGAETIDDVVEKTRLTGDLVGSCESADETADTMETQLDIVSDALADEERPRGLYYFFGFTAGADTFVDEIVTAGGVDNMAAAGEANATQSSGYFLVSAETVVAEDPEWFVLNGDEYDEARVPAGPNDAFTETTAAREGNAVVLDANEISQPAPRVVDAVLDLVKAVHPEAYREEIRSRLDSDDDLDGAKQVRATTLADGSVRLEARNLGRDDQVSFAVPDRPNATTTLQRVNVSLATVNPSFTIDLRYPTAADAPTSLNGTYALTRFSLESNGLADEDVERLRVRFSVDERTLAARDATAENVTLYRHDGTAWTALDTRVVASANGSVVYEATAPGASSFVVAVPETEAARAVTATPTATPEPSTTAPSTTAEQTARTTSTPQPTTAPPTTTGTEFPGFGPVVAVVALVVSLLAARSGRR
ncbi:ABC transporter substrate-binding protein [Salinigranum salinum]|uniref:ABC transporter substrate-binding protein n=1 Tax=Salinigranum salinum TaxID=1364937 RepID=UPI001260BC91|nr:ABC transporter substrate-binding protein [Salinigranum salinum]